MHKLLPFRQYSEKDVINLAQLDVSGATAIGNLKPGTSDGTLKDSFWSGSLVKVPATNTTLGDSDPSLTTNSYLGAIGSGDQGFAMQEGNQYPAAPLKLTGAGSANHEVLGITLKATLAFDENDEKLLYYKRKLDELQAVLPGETVPVATRGIFTITTGGAAATKVGIADGTITPGMVLGGHGSIVSVFQTIASAAHGLGRVLATGTNGGKAVALVTFDAGA